VTALLADVGQATVAEVLSDGTNGFKFSSLVVASPRGYSSLFENSAFVGSGGVTGLNLTAAVASSDNSTNTCRSCPAGQVLPAPLTSTWTPPDPGLALQAPIYDVYLRNFHVFVLKMQEILHFYCSNNMVVWSNQYVSGLGRLHSPWCREV